MTKIVDCEGCIQGKHHRLSFGSQVNKSTKPGDLVFADVCCPIEDVLSGFRYYVIFKDDFSSFRATYLLHRKNQVTEKLGFFLEIAKMQAKVTITELRTDNGMEFDNNEVRQLAQNAGLKHSLSAIHATAEWHSRMRELHHGGDGAFLARSEGPSEVHVG